MKHYMLAARPAHLVIAGLCVLLLNGFLVPAVAMAKEQPIQIEADKMTAQDKKQTVVFEGDVDARQGDVRIQSDTMTIYYLENEDESEEDGKYAQQVDKIICTGNVEVTSKEWLGTSDTMHYISRKNLIKLIGNAKAFQDQNMVQGERIHYYLDTGTSEVLGGVKTEVTQDSDEQQSGRVNMTILEQ